MLTSKSSLRVYLLYRQVESYRIVFKNSPQVSRLPLVFVTEEATISATYLFFVRNFSSLGTSFDQHFATLACAYYSIPQLCRCFSFRITYFNRHCTDHQTDSEFHAFTTNEVSSLRSIFFYRFYTRFPYDPRPYSSSSFTRASPKFLFQPYQTLPDTMTHGGNFSAIVRRHDDQRTNSNVVARVKSKQIVFQLFIQMFDFYGETCPRNVTDV